MAPHNTASFSFLSSVTSWRSLLSFDCFPLRVLSVFVLKQRSTGPAAAPGLHRTLAERPQEEPVNFEDGGSAYFPLPRAIQRLLRA